MFKKLSLKMKLLIAFLLVGIVPFSVMAVVALYKASEALSHQAFAQMDSMRDVKKAEVVRYLQTVKDQAITFSEDHMIVTAMSHFANAFTAFEAENLLGPDDIAGYREKLAGYYRNDFSAAYGQKNDGRNPDVAGVLGKLDDRTVALQYHYIQANSHPLGSKDKLDRAGDKSQYSHYHNQYHPIIRNFLDKFGYYDIFLVHPETGKIVYSVYKELDYATSLIDGPYAGTNFADAFRKASATGSPGAVVFTDFRPVLRMRESTA